MRRWGFVAAFAASALLAACGGTDSHAGALILGVQGPQGARAVMVRVVGPVDTVTVPTGKPYHLFSSRGTGDTTVVVVAAGAGDVLSGAIALLQVPNTHAAPSFKVLQVASPGYTLLPDSVYSIKLLASAQ